MTGGIWRTFWEKWKLGGETRRNEKTLGTLRLKWDGNVKLGLNINRSGQAWI
jgi:hypothetical protein